MSTMNSAALKRKRAFGAKPWEEENAEEMITDDSSSLSSLLDEDEDGDDHQSQDKDVMDTNLPHDDTGRDVNRRAVIVVHQLAPKRLPQRIAPAGHNHEDDDDGEDEDEHEHTDALPSPISHPPKRIRLTYRGPSTSHQASSSLPNQTQTTPTEIPSPTTITTSTTSRSNSTTTPPPCTSLNPSLPTLSLLPTPDLTTLKTNNTILRTHNLDFARENASLKNTIAALRRQIHDLEAASLRETQNLRRRVRVLETGQQDNESGETGTRKRKRREYEESEEEGAEAEALKKTMEAERVAFETEKAAWDMERHDLQAERDKAAADSEMYWECGVEWARKERGWEVERRLFRGEVAALRARVSALGNPVQASGRRQPIEQEYVGDEQEEGSWEGQNGGLGVEYGRAGLGAGLLEEEEEEGGEDDVRNGGSDGEEMDDAISDL